MADRLLIATAKVVVTVGLCVAFARWLLTAQR
jgi:hypothetical protein